MKFIYTFLILLLPTLCFGFNGTFIGRNADDEVRIYKFENNSNYWIYDGEGFQLDKGSITVKDDNVTFDSSLHGIESYTLEHGRKNYRTKLLYYPQSDGVYEMHLYRLVNVTYFEPGNWYGSEFENYPVPEFRERPYIDIEKAENELTPRRSWIGLWKFGVEYIYVNQRDLTYLWADNTGVIFEEGKFEVDMGVMCFYNSMYEYNSKNNKKYKQEWLDDYTILLIDRVTDEEVGILEKVGKRGY